MSTICSVCQKSVGPGLFGIRIECGHWIHTKHLDKKNPDFEQCPACKGDVDLNVPLVDEKEPLSINGRDYVKEPVTDSLFTLKSGEPFTWLKEHKPIGWMIHEKGFGLQKMLQYAVCMNDFLNNGYRWRDLKNFRDLTTGADTERGRLALVALKTNAEHFRGALGYEPITDLQINGRHLVELYGFCFPERGGPLYVIGGANNEPWKASELVSMGMKKMDLFGAGMNFLDDYLALMPSEADRAALEMNDVDIDSLYRKNDFKPKEEVIHNFQVKINYQKPRSHGLKQQPRKKHY